VRGNPEVSPLAGSQNLFQIVAFSTQRPKPPYTFSSYTYRQVDGVIKHLKLKVFESATGWYNDWLISTAAELHVLAGSIPNKQLMTCWNIASKQGEKVPQDQPAACLTL
jgi:hypothetical protein